MTDFLKIAKSIVVHFAHICAYGVETVKSLLSSCFLNCMAKKYVLLLCMLSFISLSLYITGDHYGATVALDLKV